MICLNENGEYALGYINYVIDYIGVGILIELEYDFCKRNLVACSLGLLHDGHLDPDGVGTSTTVSLLTTWSMRSHSIKHSLLMPF